MKIFLFLFIICSLTFLNVVENQQITMYLASGTNLLGFGNSSDSSNSSSSVNSNSSSSSGSSETDICGFTLETPCNNITTLINNFKGHIDQDYFTVGNITIFPQLTILLDKGPYFGIDNISLLRFNVTFQPLNSSIIYSVIDGSLGDDGLFNILVNDSTMYSNNVIFNNIDFQNLSGSNVFASPLIFVNSSGSNTEITFQSCKINNNSGFQRPVIEINSEIPHRDVQLTTLNLIDSTFNNNTEIYSIVSVNFGFVNIRGSVFSGNTGTMGLAVTGGFSQINVIKSQFINNIANTYGGAFYINGGILTIRNSVLQSNQANIGGAIYFYSTSTLSVLSSTLTNNKANTGSGLGNDIYMCLKPTGLQPSFSLIENSKISSIYSGSSIYCDSLNVIFYQFQFETTVSNNLYFNNSLIDFNSTTIPSFDNIYCNSSVMEFINPSFTSKDSSSSQDIKSTPLCVSTQCTIASGSDLTCTSENSPSSTGLSKKDKIILIAVLVPTGICIIMIVIFFILRKKNYHGYKLIPTNN